MTWPQISFVAEDHKGRIVGYVLAKMFDRLDSRLWTALTSPLLEMSQRRKENRFMDMSTQYQYYDHIDGWGSQRS